MGPCEYLSVTKSLIHIFFWDPCLFKAIHQKACEVSEMEMERIPDTIIMECCNFVSSRVQKHLE